MYMQYYKNKNKIKEEEEEETKRRFTRKVTSGHKIDIEVGMCSLVSVTKISMLDTLEKQTAHETNKSVFFQFLQNQTSELANGTV